MKKKKWPECVYKAEIGKLVTEGMAIKIFCVGETFRNLDVISLNRLPKFYIIVAEQSEQSSEIWTHIV